MRKYTFLDNASTTPCCEPALDALLHFNKENFGNPSSSHILGRQAADAIRDARTFFCDLFSIPPDQVIFTGSGSESDNLAISGVALGKKISSGLIITSCTEHPAVFNAAKALIDFGLTHKSVEVDSTGQINNNHYRSLLAENPFFVSIHTVNNVTGALLPIEELAETAKAVYPTIVFHSDAVQAFGRFDLPSSGSKVDLLSISGHKIRGPKGVGALIILNRKLLKSSIRPIVFGGNQEWGLRSGTSSPALITAFSAAAAFTFKHKERFFTHTSKLRAIFLELSQNYTFGRNLTINSSSNENTFAPHIINFSIPGLPAGAIVRGLEEHGFLVSSGAACGSTKTAPDPILKAMGHSNGIAESSIRISFSLENTEDEIRNFVKALQEVSNTLSTIKSGGRQ